MKYVKYFQRKKERELRSSGLLRSE